MKFRFKVKLNYNDFIFENGHDALDFALCACNHQADYSDDKYEVGIVVIPVEESEQEPEDNGEASAGAAMLREDS